MSLELVLPSSKYQTSYMQAIEEFSPYHLRIFEYAPTVEMKQDFSSYVQKLHGYCQGKNLPEGYVPHSEFWLVDSDEYIGRLDLRHRLNDLLLNVGGHIGYDIRPSMRKRGYGTKILELGLLKAKEMGLTKILISCSEDNIGSEKIIRKNGGIYEDKRFHEGQQVYKKRFWIDLGK